MAQVGLFKKVGKYTDNEGQERQYTNFYVRCGDALIPVQVCFFKNEDGKDPQYAGRKEVLKAFAESLPEKDKSSDSSTSTEKRGKKPQLQAFDDDGDIPF